MKKFVLTYAVIIVTALACYHVPDDQHVSFVPKDEDYKEIVSITGFDDFVIGETTYQSLLRKYGKKQVICWEPYDYVSGTKLEWGTTYRNDIDYEVRDAFYKILSKNKKINSVVLKNYMKGELSFLSFYMAFYSDTLVAIHVEPGHVIEETMRHYFIEKYGTGRGFRDSINTWLANERLRIKEHHEWENELLILTYDRNYLIDGRNRDNFALDNIYFYQHKRLYPLFLNEIEQEIQHFNQKRKESKEASLSAF